MDLLYAASVYEIYAKASDNILYHWSNSPELANTNIGETFTLIPGPQGAEGPGVYFSQGSPTPRSTAEGLARNATEKPVLVIAHFDELDPNDWWRSKGFKMKKFNKPRTWHTNNQGVELRVVHKTENDDYIQIVCDANLVDL